MSPGVPNSLRMVVVLTCLVALYCSGVMYMTGAGVMGYPTAESSGSSARQHRLRITLTRPI